MIGHTTSRYILQRGVGDEDIIQYLNAFLCFVQFPQSSYSGIRKIETPRNNRETSLTMFTLVPY